MFVKARVSRSPVLVLDVRDWYAETFLAPGAVVRPSESVRVLATPANLVGWPFAGEAELVTVASPVGFVLFFDSVRALKRPELGTDGRDVVGAEPYPASHHAPLRVHLPPGDYQLRLLCRGFQPATSMVTLPLAGALPPIGL